MLRQTSPRPRGRHSRRRGAILLVVLTMLALFAVIGLSFVLYAESEATASRISKNAVSTDLSPPDTTGAINAFIGQLTYQTDHQESALWGNELARLMYGNADFAPDRTTPYNGVGVYSEMLKMTFSGVTTSLHRSQVVRFGLIPGTTDKFILPDQTYAADPATYDYTAPPTGLNLKYVGRNAPYTYADRNNIYVAVQDPATGRIVKPSYHAPSLFGPLEATNRNWYTPQGYFQVLRPRTIDNLTSFPDGSLLPADKSEVGYLGYVGLWPVPTVPTPAQIAQLSTILTGNDPAAPASFKRAFPFPAPNPEGGPITGDVQNVRGTENQQAFDSVWLDLKLPVITYRGTRRLQPMVAATVLPLGGRVDYNVAGNLAAAGLTHGSNQGFGPAEVSLLKILQAADPVTPPAMAAFASMMNKRYGPAWPNAPAPTGTAPYSVHSDPSGTTVYPPTYSSVDFKGLGTTPPTPPGNFSTSYSYPNPPYDSNSTTAYTPPGLLFNPFQWNPYTTSGGVGNTFPLSDERYLGARYSEKDKYARLGTYLGQAIGTPTPIGYASSTPFHPMNRARALLTPISNRRAVPGLAPMAIGNITGDPTNAGAPALSLASDPAAPFATLAAPSLSGPRFDLSAGQPFVTNAVGGDITGGPTANAANVRAALLGVDLNRPLADYRDASTRPRLPPGGPGAAIDPDQNWPLSPSTISAGSYQQASNDRQNLARDIFTRLCVALNARVYFTAASGLILPQWNSMMSRYQLTDGTTTWVVTPQEFDALRWVAQLSANIVDAIDPDDISTVFQWNNPATAPAGLTAFTPDVRGGLADCVVFGVEKPKLLVNEVYAEVANKQADYAKTELMDGDKFTVRFFVELLNPSNAEVSNTPSMTVPAVDQSARNGGRAPLQFPVGPGVPTAFSSYRVQVYDKGLTVHNELASTANLNYVLGQPATTTVTASLKLQSSFLGMNSYAPPAVPPLTQSVEPNSGAFASTVGSRSGFCVIGPDVDPGTPEMTVTAYAPQTKTAPTATLLDNWMIVKPTPAAATQDQLEYDSPVAAVDSNVIKPQVVTPLNATELHAVVLQRLANPYYPENATPYIAANGPYNPYITVDYLAGVEVHDGIRIGKKGAGTDGTRTTMPPTPADNHSVGRAQPYAGNQSVAAMTAPVAVLTAASAVTPPLAQTLSVLQNPTAVPAAPSAPTKTTFFQHNSVSPPPSNPYVAVANDTLIYPFREPFQPDRRLINPLEILHLSMAPSHLLTRNFATPNGTNTPSFYQQELLTRVRTPVTTDINAKLAANPFYRALEVLSVKPWTYGIPHGGRVPGGINVNAVWDDEKPLVSPPVPGDSTVFNALLDPQPANSFSQGTISSTPAVPGSPGTPKIFGIWERLRTSRSPAWTSGFGQQWVGATVDEIDPATGLPGFDRPFKGFGVGQYYSAPVSPTLIGGVLDSPMRLPNYPPIPPLPMAPAVASYFPSPDTGNANGHGVESTFLRTFGDGQPVFSNPGQPDPYFQLEPLRKAFNNLTTVSDNYLVVFTVGFFDIVEEAQLAPLPPTRVILRREAYEQVPGDLRTQYTAVIDRTGLAIADPNAPGAPSTPGVTGKCAQAIAATRLTPILPYFPSGGKNYAQYLLRFPAVSNVGSSIQIRDDPNVANSTFSLSVNSQFRLGDGPNAQYFTVQALGATDTQPGPPPTTTTYLPHDAATGLGTVTINSGIEVDVSGNPVVPGQQLPFHAAGELIRLPDNEFNAGANTVFVPGNPGRVQISSPTDPRIRGVVRYFGKMQP